MISLTSPICLGGVSDGKCKRQSEIRKSTAQNDKSITPMSKLSKIE